MNTPLNKNLLYRTKELRVLYVEDSVVMRHATTKILQEYFKSVDSATDGAKGHQCFLDFYDKHSAFYDIVITDLEMPNMDGHELSRRILYINPHQEIVIISSHKDSSELIDLINLGITKFLTKPIEENLLQKIIADIANDLYAQRLKKEELDDLAQHNKLLMQNENEYLERLQSSLKSLEEFNAALNESGIVSKSDPHGIITYVNDSFCLISGYTRDELLGQKHSIINSGEMSSSFFAKLWNTINNRKSYKGVFKNRSKDGSFYYVESLIKPIVDTEGNITEYIAIEHDMTRMMESMENAKRAETSKDDFFRNISHEMRTPLNAIMGLASLLIRRAKDAKFKDALMIIDESAHNLHQMIESILDVQNIQSNNLKLNEKEFEVIALLQNCMKICNQKSDKTGIDFAVQFNENLPLTLVGDSMRIQQIFNEILDNAFKFTPKGGKVDFHVSYEDNMLLAQITDTGIGISKKDQQKIYTITQIDGSLLRKHEGAGLGLTIANALVNKMNGSLTIHSHIDQGTTFLIELPLNHP
jgi:PAS domain S-box-containing protein